MHRKPLGMRSKEKKLYNTSSECTITNSLNFEVPAAMLCRANILTPVKNEKTSAEILVPAPLPVERRSVDSTLVYSQPAAFLSMLLFWCCWGSVSNQSKGKLTFDGVIKRARHDPLPVRVEVKRHDLCRVAQERVQALARLDVKHPVDNNATKFSAGGRCTNTRSDCRRKPPRLTRTCFLYMSIPGCEITSVTRAAARMGRHRRGILAPRRVEAQVGRSRPTTTLLFPKIQNQRGSRIF